MKHVFKAATRRSCPDVIAERKDKMGFPVPLTEWMRGPAARLRRRRALERARSSRARTDRQRERARRPRSTSHAFARKIWGLLCLELWQQSLPRPRARLQAPADRRKDDNDMKVLITGGAGFIGSHLADRLLAAATRCSSSTTTRPAAATTSPSTTRLTVVEDTIADADAVDRRVRGASPPTTSSTPRRLTRTRTTGPRMSARTSSARQRRARRAGCRRRRLIYFQTALCYGTHPDRAADHARAPDPPGFELRDLEDGRRAVHRAVAGSTSSRSASPTPTGRATSPARCRRSSSASPTASRASSWTPAATSSSSTI